MAEQIDSPKNDNADPSTTVARTRRSERAAAAAAAAQTNTRPPARVTPAQTAPPSRRPAAASEPKPRRKVLKGAAALAMVGGLVAAVAVPAFGAFSPTAYAKSQPPKADAPLIVASDASYEKVTAESYGATTPDQLAKAKAAAAAAARAKQQRSESAASVRYSIDLKMFAPGGTIRWPLTRVDHIGDGFGSRGGEHMGVDLLDPAGTTIYAATAGKVTASAYPIGGYGECIYIETNIGGRVVTTVYGHMLSGSRQVHVGDTVQAGQPIGLVGSTGRSTANHLHFEVHLDGRAVDPLSWLRTNAGAKF